MQPRKRWSLVCAVAGAAVLGASSAEAATEVNLAGQGLLPVTAPAGTTAASLRVNGVAPADVENDVARFDKQALIRAGALTPGTRQLTATARRSADGSMITASEPVDVQVVLEVKLKAGAATPDLGGTLTPLVPKAVADAARARAGKGAPDMSAWYTLTLPADTDVDTTLARLNNRSDVAAVEPAPAAAPPPQITAPPVSTTPDFSAMQGYNMAAPQGIDSVFARQDSRARGAGVRVADLEYYWTSNHEDLQLTPANDLGGAAYPQYTAFADEHGTAVFGEIAAKDNGYGVTGGAPDATMDGISPTRATSRGSTYDPASALTYVAQFLSPGDVVLIEQQTVGPDGGTAYVPLEWVQSDFDAMKLLTAMGVVVVETGGNGGENLDAANMLGRFDRSVRDSGAIIVGAGTNTDHAPEGYSSWGSRMDLQGWGQNVVSTGFNGNLFGADDLTKRYTRSFSGTSSAGPIVASAVADLESYLKATRGAPFTAAQVDAVLRATGTPQGGDPIHAVGPLPNLQGALRAVETDPPTTTATLSPAPIENVYIDPTVTLTAGDGWGSGVAKIEYRLDGGDWTTYATPFGVLAPGAHTLAYRATDDNGNVETPKSLTFNVFDKAPHLTGAVAGTVPATLALTLTSTPSFGAFIPGVTTDYLAAGTATVTSSAGDAALSVADPSATAPGHLVNGTFALASVLQARAGTGSFAALSGTPATLLTYAGPTANDAVALQFKQSIAATDALRTGSYAKALTFTLSTTTP